MLIKDFDDDVPTAQIKQQMAERAKAGIDFSLYYPTLRHEAWDVAVAKQSASYLAPETQRRLSVAYAAQRDLNPANLTLLINIPGYVNALKDARVGASDPHEFLRSMRQVELTMEGANSRFAQLEATLQEALPDDPASAPALTARHAAPAAPSAAAAS